MINRWPSLALIAGILALWQIFFWIGGANAISPPLETVRYAVVNLLGSSMFWPHLLETTKAFVVAFLIAGGAGIAVGCLLGMNRTAGDVASPMLVSLYSVPKVTLYPVILLIFGIGLPAKIVFGALHGFVPVAIFAMNGVRNIAPVFLKTAKVLRMTRWSIVRRLVLPGVLPEIFTGLRVGFALSLLGTLLGEMFGSQRGVGYLLMNAIGLHNMLMITSLVLMLAVFSVSVNSILLWVDRRLREG